MLIWRVCKDKHKKTAFSGEGGFYTSSRWMPQGFKVVYGAESLALATLEVFVHTESDKIPLVAIRAFLPDSIPMEEVTVQQLENLDPNWQNVSAYPIQQSLGKEWISSKRTPVLKVPSAIVPVEYNYLLNPSHPDFTYTSDPPLQFRFDPRMWKASPQTLRLK